MLKYLQCIYVLMQNNKIRKNFFFTVMLYLTYIIHHLKRYVIYVMLFKVNR